MGDGRAQQCCQILRGIRQSRIRADGDALHALRAVFRDEERGFAAGNVLGCGVACSGGDHAHGRQRRGRLVIAEVRAELGVEVGHAGQRRASGLAGGHRIGTAAGSAGAASGNRLQNRQQRMAAQTGVIGRAQLADLDLIHLVVALHHDFHV